MKIFIIIILVGAIGIFSDSNLSSAAVGHLQSGSSIHISQTTLGSPSVPDRSSNWGLDGTAAKSGLIKDRNFPPLSYLIGRFINPLLGLLGAVFMVLIIYAGVLWMMAAGNEEQVGKAKKIIYTAVIGLLLVVFAYTISRFIVSNIFKTQAVVPVQSISLN